MYNRVPAVADVEIGTLLRDPKGHLFVVTSKREEGYSTVALEDITDGDGDWDERVAYSGWLSDCYPQALAGTADPDVISAIHQRTAYHGDVADIMATVPPADHRTLYNTIAGVQHWAGKIADAQAQVTEYSKLRADELRKLVAIVGSQDKAAKLLGINQSTLSRALRDR